MMIIEADHEFEALYKHLKIIVEKGSRVNSFQEIQPLLVKVNYRKDRWNNFQDYKEDFLELTGNVGLKGWDRATRVYTTTQDRRSKPSYLNRLISYPDKPQYGNHKITNINQIDTIVNEFINKPGYSCLSYIYLRPADLIDKFRPGYVPCALAGDVKFRDGKLFLNVMFRTNNALTVGYADIYYQRKLQISFLEQAKSISENERIQNGQIGDLYLYFSRSYIPKRIKNSNGCKIDGIKLANKLIADLENKIM